MPTLHTLSWLGQASTLCPAHILVMPNRPTLQGKKLRPREPKITPQDLEMLSLDAECWAKA